MRAVFLRTWICLRWVPIISNWTDRWDYLKFLIEFLCKLATWQVQHSMCCTQTHSMPWSPILFVIYDTLYSLNVKSQFWKKRKKVVFRWLPTITQYLHISDSKTGARDALSGKKHLCVKKDVNQIWERDKIKQITVASHLLRQL